MKRLSKAMPALFALLFVMLSIAGCGREPSPEFQVEEFYAYLRTQSPSAMQHVYSDLLSAETKALLDARAKELTAVSGVTVNPWDVLVFRGFVRGDRIAKKEVVERTDEQARVEVSFEWYVPAEEAKDKARRPPPEPYTFTLVHQDGQWRIHLPELMTSRGP